MTTSPTIAPPSFLKSESLGQHADWDVQRAPSAADHHVSRDTTMMTRVVGMLRSGPIIFMLINSVCVC